MDYAFQKEYFCAHIYNSNNQKRAYFYMDTEESMADIKGRAIIFANEFVDLRVNSGGAFRFQRENDGMPIAKIDSYGNFYEGGTSLSNKYQAKGNYLTAIADTYGYYGIASPTGADNVWVRTTSAGIIPYKQGQSTAGNCYLGTESWYFANAYIQYIHGTAIYENGTALSRKYLALSGGTVSGNIYLAGGTSYFLKNNGSAKLNNIACGSAALSTSYVINAGGDTYLGGTCTINGRTQPATDNARYLGYSSNRWKTIYASNGTINTSDRNQKHDINYNLDSTRLEGIFYGLKPVTYIMNNGQRTHIGIIAQDAQEVIEKYGYTMDDLAFLCRDHEYEIEQTGDGYREIYKFNDDGTPKYIYGVRYTELISLNIWQTQKHETRLNNQQQRLGELEERINALERENTELKQVIEKSTA